MRAIAPATLAATIAIPLTATLVAILSAVLAQVRFDVQAGHVLAGNGLLDELLDRVHELGVTRAGQHDRHA